jgi:hypothetical protein
MFEATYELAKSVAAAALNGRCALTITRGIVIADN